MTPILSSRLILPQCTVMTGILLSLFLVFLPSAGCTGDQTNLGSAAAAEKKVQMNIEGARLVPVSNWREAREHVEARVAAAKVGDRPLTVKIDEYMPENFIIHEDGVNIDWPVSLSADQWHRLLSDEQFEILRQEGTEPPFENPLHDNKRKGIYYSVATGQPLFRSEDKFDSKTGWPSFTRPIHPLAVAYVWDRSLFSNRIEVVDSLSGSHIGHVFDDGPPPTGQRYCMNSAALVFVGKEEQPPPLLLPEEDAASDQKKAEDREI